MTNSLKRVLTSIGLTVILGGAALGEYFGLHLVQILAVSVAGGMIIEFIICMFKNSKKIDIRNLLFIAWLFIVLVAAYYTGARPWILLLLFMIISSADVGAWFFGRLIGGDKMWENLSAGKTWAGQIAGIICGTIAAVMYGLLGTDTFMPQLLWIGISLSLLSQYGDLMASAIKRKMGIKDFSNILPGHGGLLDRFDGWIIVLPIVWLMMI